MLTLFRSGHFFRQNGLRSLKGGPVPLSALPNRYCAMARKGKRWGVSMLVLGLGADVGMSSHASASGGVRRMEVSLIRRRDAFKHPAALAAGCRLL